MDCLGWQHLDELRFHEENVGMGSFLAPCGSSQSSGEALLLLFMEGQLVSRPGMYFSHILVMIVFVLMVWALCLLGRRAPCPGSCCAALGSHGDSSFLACQILTKSCDVPPAFLYLK